MYLVLMRPQKISDTTILIGLTHVFRSKGYEGASLKNLSEATGLQKASLYHRFPNGKQEMATAVLHHLGKWVEAHVFQALLDTDLTPEIRLKNGVSAIRELYNGGHETCIFRALSMQGGIALFEEQIRNGMTEWLSVFKKIGVAFGLHIPQAEQAALQALIEIQGSLIVSKSLGDPSIFEHALQHLEDNYLKK